VTGNAMYKKNVEQLSREFARYKPNELVARYIAELLQPLHTTAPNSYRSGKHEKNKLATI
jgi:hypothetical protein